MGMMVEGIWQADEPPRGAAGDGRYRRAASTIRHWIMRGSEFAPDAGRYHIYAAWNCPWAHRVTLARTILGLEDAVSIAFARPRRTDQGWVYDPEGEYADPCLGVAALHEVFARQPSPYSGRVTTPVLWDRESRQIVSTESSDIVRMLGSFGRGPDLWPAGVTVEIEDWNRRIHAGLNNGVYRTGFARTQAAYDEAVAEVFETLDRIEAQLRQTPYLTGEDFTEADLRLFPTLARFDVAYHYAFKCNIRRLVDYPALWEYARRIYALPGVAGTVRFEAYKQGYFAPSELRNPLGIVPAGPEIDWSL